MNGLMQQIIEMLGKQGQGISPSMMTGMMSGSNSRGKPDTSGYDHQLGMSALEQYKDMSQAYSMPANGLGSLGALASMSQQRPMQRRAYIDPYVQYLLSRISSGGAR